MIRKVRVKNYKSITDLDFDLGRVTVLIGANGSGKSNILEAVALGSAAAQYKVDNEFLSSRGIRVTETRFMHSAFGRTPTASEAIKFTVTADNEVEFDCELLADETASYPKWKQTSAMNVVHLAEFWRNEKLPSGTRLTADILNRLLTQASGTLPGFLVYAPENSALRTFQSEGQILPLGIRGEGSCHISDAGSPE
jgi:ABC-type hemin transport system ATPase subunit